MGKNLVIISEAETFSVRGIEMKLQGIGMTTVYAMPKLTELEKSLEGADLIVFYTDTEIVTKNNVLSYLRDYCDDHEIKMMVIGSKNEYEDVENVITDSYIAGFFDRPLDMNKFLDEVESFCLEDHNRRKSILIVDDNVTYMSMIMDWLKDSYRVSMANSGMAAITWLASNHPDLILLDYEMPITSGPQVLEMIRSDPGLADIPVIFLTGVDDKDSIMNVLELKPADYLLKTIDKKGLQDKIDIFFATRKSGVTD